LPTLQDALAGRTILQVDQAASANQALLRQLDQRSQNSGLDRSVRLRTGCDLEARTSTAAKFTQHFTSLLRDLTAVYPPGVGVDSTGVADGEATGELSGFGEGDGLAFAVLRFVLA
jgi:hypothetical protein